MKRKQYDIEKITGAPWQKKKSYRYLYRLACQKAVILRAFHRMRKKKTKRHDIQEAMKSLDAWVDRIQQVILNTKPDGWKVERPEMTLKAPNHKPIIITERGKERKIYVPTIEELWVQHVIVLILEPILVGSSYYHSYASMPGRGAHKGKRTLERWIRGGKGVRYFAQCDIRHFYGHVRYALVRERLARRVHDNLFLHLVDACMARFRTQLPLGFYLSQWMANLVLQDLDHCIKQVLKVARYVRYMDNLTLATDSKKTLHAALARIRQMLGKLRLRMKSDWQVFRFEYQRKDGSVTGRPLRAMGFVFHRQWTGLAKQTLLNASRTARLLGKKRAEGKAFPISACRGMMSHLGYLRHTDTYNWYLEHVKPNVNARTVKRIISKTDKREERKNAARTRVEKRGVRRAA